MNHLLSAALAALSSYWDPDSSWAFLVLALAATCFVEAGRLMRNGHGSWHR